MHKFAGVGHAHGVLSVYPVILRIALAGSTCGCIHDSGSLFSDEDFRSRSCFKAWLAGGYRDGLNQLSIFKNIHGVFRCIYHAHHGTTERKIIGRIKFSKDAWFGLHTHEVEIYFHFSISWPQVFWPKFGRSVIDPRPGTEHWGGGSNNDGTFHRILVFNLFVKCDPYGLTHPNDLSCRRRNFCFEKFLRFNGVKGVSDLLSAAT